MNFNLGVCRIIEQIIECSIGDIDLYNFLENIWGIYILIKDNENLDFQHIFHESWDYIDEIIGLNIEDKNIYTTVLPKFKQNMIKFL